MAPFMSLKKSKNSYYLKNKKAWNSTVSRYRGIWRNQSAKRKKLSSRFVVNAQPYFLHYLYRQIFDSKNKANALSALKKNTINLSVLYFIRKLNYQNYKCKDITKMFTYLNYLSP